MGLRELALEESESGPLEVVYSSPTGQVSGPAEVTILFNRSMLELGDAANTAMPPIRIEPAVPGQWQWTGSRALSFIPAKPGGGGSYRLPHATAFTVTVPKGTKALSGDELAADHSFTFETSRPRIESTTPYHQARGLTPDTTFDVYLSQPVSKQALESNLSLSAAGSPVPFSVELVSTDNDKLFRVKPKSPLPLDAKVVLDSRKGLVGIEGKLPSEKSSSFEFRTYGPLAVSSIGCSWNHGAPACPAGSGISVEFTNPVKVRAAREAVSIQPGLKFKVPSYLTDDEFVSSLDLEGKFAPGQSYNVTVGTPLVDTYQQALRSSVSRSVSFADVEPMVRVGLTNGVLEPTAKREVQIGHINASDVSYSAFKLDEETLLALAGSSLSSSELLAKGGGVKPKSVARGRRNVVERTSVSLDDVLGGPKARGAFAIITSYGDPRKPELSQTVAQVTDLGITAKLSREGSFFVVTQLSDARPVAGAEVRIRRPGAPTLSKTTDAEGTVLFAKNEFVPNFDDEKGAVFVRTKEDSAYFPLSDNLLNWSFDASEDQPFGLVFDDRGIYRPGDKVQIKGVVREALAVGLKTPSSGAVAVSVEGPSGDVLQTTSAQLSPFGTFSATVTLPQTARLGSYGISAMLGNVTVANDYFEVAEYRASEFKVRAESDRPSYIRGDQAKWTVGGDFLYGAPMAGARSNTLVGRSRTWFSPPNHSDFATSDDSYQEDRRDQAQNSGEVTSNDVPLDAAGMATLSAKLEMPGQIGPEQVRADLEVTDLTRQVIGTTTTAVVHPAEHYVGVRLDERFVAAGTVLTPEFVAMTPAGERTVGAPIRVSLLKRKWATAKQGVGADVTTVTSPVDETVASCNLTSARTPVTCKLTPKDAGYYILRATSEDSRKNPVAASLVIYVTGESGDSFASFEETDSSEIELVLDKETYKVGDKAKVLVKSPWKNAEALVTTERKGVLDRRWVTLTGAAPLIEVPVTEAVRPNVYLSVLVFKKRTGKQPSDWLKPDVGAPGYRIGYAQISVEKESRRLAVDVVPSSTNLSPGAELGVTLKVKDAQGRGTKSEVTLIAADLGVLSLVGYQLPDPVAVFGAPQSLRVATLESRSDFANLFSPLSGVGLDKGLAGGGGGESGAGGATRSDFRASAYYNAAIVTDDAGQATVQFKLPDGLTTYRLMAMAVGSDDKMGSGMADVTSSRALMVRPALPRFLRAGDSFEAAAIVSIKGVEAQDIDVSATATGLTLSGETSKRVHVEPGRSTEVKFPAVAMRSGSFDLKFDAKTNTSADSVTMSRKVMTPAVMEAVALYGNTDSAAAERLGDLSALRDDVGELTISTSSTALVGLDAGGNQLLDYPYGCTEQLTSKLVPLVALKDLQKDFGFEVPANLDDVVNKTIARLLAHQRYNGDFGLWADSPATNPWATIYAAWGLNQAKKAGYAVPASAVADSKRALEGLFEGDKHTAVRRAGPFALLVLAEMGEPDAARASLLFEQRAELPLYSKAMLLSAMVLSKNDPANIAELTKEVESKISLDGPIGRTTENLGSDYAPYLDSNVRTSALVLSALLRANPKHPMAAPLALGLVADRRGSEWRTTQEAAWALLALGDYRRAFEAEEPDFIARTFFGDDVLFEQTFKGRSLAEQKSVMPVANLFANKGAQMTFMADGPGRLYYQARLRYARRELPKAPLDRGFFVDKKVRVVTMKDLPEMLATVPDVTQNDVKGGDLMLVDLVVVTPKSRTFVAIDDPLPAGFEAVDSRLSTTSSRLMNLAGPRMDDDDAAMERSENASYFTNEVRDDRVLFFVDDMAPGIYRYRYLARATTRGKFIVPPTHASEMYTPEVFGRTAAVTVSVE